MDTHDPRAGQRRPSKRRAAVAGTFVAAVAAAAFAIPAFAAGNDTAATSQSTAPAAAHRVGHVAKPHRPGRPLARRAATTAAPGAPAKVKTVMFNAAGKRVSNEADATVIIGCAVANPSASAGVPVNVSAPSPAVPAWVNDIDYEGLLSC